LTFRDEEHSFGINLVFVSWFRFHQKKIFIHAQLGAIGAYLSLSLVSMCGCKFFLVSTVLVVLLAIVVPFIVEVNRHRHECNDVHATNAYCNELKRIEESLEAEALSEIVGSGLLTGVENIAEQLQSAPRGVNADLSKYEFKLKGIKHIDPHCLPRSMHYFRTVDGVW
jgi:hypothetical protein